MKLSDYVAQFLANQGIRHVFVVAGGASIHLIHSIADTDGIDYVCPQHEQAGAMAADAYARVTDGLGAAITTSGPGATNLITGIGCAYFDSVPVIYITGQVATFRARGDSGVRQMGFQEADTVDIMRPITKYAVRVDDPKMIRFELEKAVHLATTSRPGPVVIDIPDDVQRSAIDPEALVPFIPEPEPILFPSKARECCDMISRATRPVMILGWGAHKAATVAKQMAEKLGIPVLPTWAAKDILPSSHPLLVGTFGTHGSRYGNFTVQNADLILAIGTRLDTRHAGSPPVWFAREAKKIVVDIDPSELGKFERQDLHIDLPIQCDALEFLTALNGCATHKDCPEWWARIKAWKERYPICEWTYHAEEEVNPYVFVKTLSDESQEGDIIVVDTGCAVAWMMQAFETKPNQRLFHDFNNTAMGYALPAAIGACFATGKPVTCVTGDGSLQMNIQELATVIRHQLPIRIFLINNHGYNMIQQTQDQWLDSRYLASTVEGGLAFPDFIKVAGAYGFKTLTIEKNRGIRELVHEALSGGPVFCNVEISPKHRVIPQVKFGRPIEDSEPLLDRDTFLGEMIVAPVSLKPD